MQSHSHFRSNVKEAVAIVTVGLLLAVVLHPLGMVIFAGLLFSSPLFVIAVIRRFYQSDRPWRFSLSTLLIAMTLMAGLLGIISVALHT
jgi:hypothetical protein